jgi:hypothetical protein
MRQAYFAPSGRTCSSCVHETTAPLGRCLSACIHASESAQPLLIFHNSGICDGPVDGARTPDKNRIRKMLGIATAYIACVRERKLSWH